MASVALVELKDYLGQLLEVDTVEDYCPNGLQVEGRPVISRIVTGVTACQALLDKAMMLRADAVIVHHGYFWRGEAEPITGMKYRRLKTLFEGEMSLLAYHLPLDVHPEFGNNIQLAEKLGLQVTGRFSPDGHLDLVLLGELAKPLGAEDFAAHVAKTLGREPTLVTGGDHDIQSIALCTGAAQGFIGSVAECGVDAYLSGEISEPTVHVARERSVHYIAAGHHATERYGIEALGNHLASAFNLEVHFVDIASPA